MTEPDRVGVRDGRRVVGERHIETADAENGADVPDAVALSTWPIELREQATGPRLRYPRDGRRRRDRSARCGAP